MRAGYKDIPLCPIPRYIHPRPMHASSCPALIMRGCIVGSRMGWEGGLTPHQGAPGMMPPR